MPTTAVDLHYEHRRLKKFHTGDLILFSGAGPQNIATRLETGSQYSSAGMLVELPNKWTKAQEWYVVEATDNSDGLVDPFADSRAPGLRIFKIDERLYNFHGSIIWWVPQTTPMEEDQADILRRWILSAHDGSKDRPFPPPDPKNIEHIGWKQIEVPSDRVKFLGEFYERAKHEEPIYYPLHSGQLLALALSAIGIIDSSTTDVAKWTIENLVTHPFWKMTKNRILRVSQDCHSWYTATDTDKNTKFSFAHLAAPAAAFADISSRVPSEKTFAQQSKQISGLQAASNVQLSPEESNLLHAASKELLKKKKNT